ncbi:MAG: GNAT family N-acetyltransferase [Planctomycetota bacterium]|nr:GNAT family N-acetyltransferase [Planctomycetota bacterium]
MMIRLAAEGDLPAIVEIANWAAAHTTANFAIEPEPLSLWQENFEKTRVMHPWLVAVDEGGAIAGFAKSSPWARRCAYSHAAEVTVYVESSQHGRGVGTALYAALLPTLDAQGYRSLLAGITQPNDASVRLHERFGFRRCAVFHHIGFKFGSWHDVGFWERISRAGEGEAPPAPLPLRPVAEVWRGKAG